MKFDIERIYNLLPAFHRIRDYSLVDNDSETPPLKALLSILAEEVEFLEENIDQLHDDYFIETCAEWVIPYIGELVGNRPLVPIPSASFSARTEVANTIGYRRRKGTLSILEQLARDVTNYDASVVEYFKLLATTQYLNHLRPENVVTPHLKNWEQLEHINSPFDSIPRTADVRNISNRRGKYNIPNIGIYLWRIQAYRREKVKAFLISDSRYTFHPLGLNSHLYNFPIVEQTISQLAKAINMPTPLNRRITKEYLENHYGEDLNIFVQIAPDQDILLENVCIGDLSNWEDASIVPPTDTVVIDPILGRLMFGSDFTDDLANNDVNLWYNRGIYHQLGGGEYDRLQSFTDFDRVITVSNEIGTADFLTIQAAIDEAESTNLNTTIEIVDNYTYQENLSLNIQSGQTIELRAANGFQASVILTSDFTIQGDDRSEFIINGIQFRGGDVVTSGSLEKLTLKHAYFLPDQTENKINLQSTTQLIVISSVLSGINTFAGSNLVLTDSVVDSRDRAEKAISADEDQLANLTVKNSTIIGEVDVRSIDLIENSIFVSLIKSQFLQTGCVRFSYLPIESTVPKKYNCYPHTIEGQEEVEPMFVSIDLGSAAYLQLSLKNNSIFLEGADDGAEIGVYHNTYQPQKEANLRSRLNEYLRFGMEAGIFYAS